MSLTRAWIPIIRSLPEINVSGIVFLSHTQPLNFNGKKRVGDTTKARLTPKSTYKDNRKLN